MLKITYGLTSIQSLDDFLKERIANLKPKVKGKGVKKDERISPKESKVKERS